MATNRYLRLKSKIMKTFNSVRYVMYSTDAPKGKDLQEYIHRIHTGIMNLFQNDTTTYVKKISEPLTVRVIIHGQFIEDVTIVPSNIVGPVNYKDINPIPLSPLIKDYVIAYINALLDTANTVNIEDHVDVILEHYMNLTKVTAEKSPGGYQAKFEIY